MQDVRALNEIVANQSAFIDELTSEVGKVIVGQTYMIERILIGLLTDGHVLLEGVPGLAKTLTVRTVCDAIDARFARVQFTPDLLPADLIGTVIYNQKTAEFSSKLGPIFANLVLADEINRAPAKVQSALLEAMLMIKVSYPDRSEERAVMDRMTGVLPARAKPVATTTQLAEARRVIRDVYVDDRVKDYIVDVVFATREPERKGMKDLAPLIEYGASPRASIALNLTARAHAFLRHRGYVTPEDVKAIGPDVLRHRLVLSYEAEAEEITAEDVVRRVFEVVEVP
jgi:MoxR-like ATPase